LIQLLTMITVFLMRVHVILAETANVSVPLLEPMPRSVTGMEFMSTGELKICVQFSVTDVDHTIHVLAHAQRVVIISIHGIKL
jgi:hypothetical protein